MKHRLARTYESAVCLPLCGLVMTMNETTEPRGATEISMLTALTREKT